MKRNHKILMIVLLLAAISFGCKYVVIPEDLIAEQETFKAWNAVVTGVTQSPLNQL